MMMPPPGGLGQSPSGDYQSTTVAGSGGYDVAGMVWWNDRLAMADRRGRRVVTFTPPSTFTPMGGLSLVDPTDVGLDADGNLLVADCGPCQGRGSQSRILRVTTAGMSSTAIEFDGRIQDIAVHRSGTAYWGAFDSGAIGAGALQGGGGTFQLMPAFDYHSYGAAMSPDGNTVYVSSKKPGNRRIVAFALDMAGRQAKDGAGMTVLGKMVVNVADSTAIGDSVGRLQGITVDARGNLYAVGDEGQSSPAVAVFDSATGNNIARIATAGGRQSVAFGGADLRTLYIGGSGGLRQVTLPVTGIAQ
jgi:sugar lactone lactonase YvrE